MGLLYDCGNGYYNISFAKKEMNADAYLCCPGPSLNLIDPNTINGLGRKVFAINTTYPYIKPDIWLGMDRIECYDRNILYEPFIKIFRAPLYHQLSYNGKPVSSYDNVFWMTIKEPEKDKTLFDYRGHGDNFVWHKSTLMVSIHLMVWMGATTIYFVGCDMGGSEDYYKGNILTQEQRNYNRRLYNVQVKHLNEIVLEGKNRGINFYSSTPNSPINEFMEYIPIENAIKKSEKKIVHEKENNKIMHVLDVPRPATIITVYDEKNPIYNKEYVYKLRDSIKKQLPFFKFVCLTNSDELNNIETIKFKYNWGGDYKKLEIFENFNKGRFIYISLDCLIKNRLVEITRFNGFTMIEDFVNSDVRNDSVMAWEGDFSHIINKFKENPNKYIEQYKPISKQFQGKEWKSCGVQKYIEDTIGVDNIKTWDNKLISSYKISSKDRINKSSIVVFHGKPKPHEVNWNYYRNEFKEKKREKILHITNWGIWGGVQSVILSISKEYKEYDHVVYTINSRGVQKDCVDYFDKNNICFESFNGMIKKEDVDRINPKLMFLHNTKAYQLENSGKFLSEFKTVRVHHGWNLSPLKVDLNWFVSDFVYSKLNYEIDKYFILPPVTYVKDYFNIERPEREPIVGRIQSQTAIGGKPFPQSFYDLIKKLNSKLFIVGPEDNSIEGIIKHGNIQAGKMQEYLKEIDIFVIWQDKIETWSLVATEANLSGIPVVARRINDGLTEQLNKSGGGVLVDTEEEFINSVNELINNKELRDKLATKGKEWLVENVNTRLLRGHLNDLLK